MPVCSSRLTREIGEIKAMFYNSWATLDALFAALWKERKEEHHVLLKHGANSRVLKQFNHDSDKLREREKEIRRLIWQDAENRAKNAQKEEKKE